MVTLHFVEILLCAFAAICVHFMLFVLVSLYLLVVIIQLLCVCVGGGSLCDNFSLLKLFYAFLWLFSYVIVLLWCMFLMCLQNFYRCEHGHGIFEL